MAKAAAPPTMTERQTSPRHGNGRWGALCPVLIVLAGLALESLLGWHRYLSLGYLGDSQQALRDGSRRSPSLAPLGFVICYTEIRGAFLPSGRLGPDRHRRFLFG